ncbi:hypothetical protein ABZ870_39770, partial [Streptomyces sp. NPDC046978]
MGEVETDGEGEVEGEPVGGVPVVVGVGLPPDGSGAGRVRVGDASGVGEAVAGLEEAGTALEAAGEVTAGWRDGGRAGWRDGCEGAGEGPAVEAVGAGCGAGTPGWSTGVTGAAAGRGFGVSPRTHAIPSTAHTATTA